MKAEWQIVAGWHPDPMLSEARAILLDKDGDMDDFDKVFLRYLDAREWALEGVGPDLIVFRKLTTGLLVAFERVP